MEAIKTISFRIKNPSIFISPISMVSPWVCNLANSSVLSFLICKRGVITVPHRSKEIIHFSIFDTGVFNKCNCFDDYC